MNSFGRSQNCLRALVAPGVLVAFCGTLLLSVYPELHERVHPDANRVDHICAVTLVESGNCHQVGQPLLISAPDFISQFGSAAVLSTTWVKPLYLDAHIFAHAPPVLHA